MERIIETEHVNRVFAVSSGEFCALKDINVSIPEGAFAILKGRSGSGKTTLMNIIGALDYPTSGKVRIAGNDITEMSETDRENMRRNMFGFVFQAVSLIPTMNAFENVEFSLRMAGISENRKERVEECLRRVGLAGRMRHMPAEMSGGEQQRVSIARALAKKPEILFLDEPTGALDEETGRKILDYIWKLKEKLDFTLIMVTHNQNIADMARTIIRVNSGKITQVVTNDQPQTAYEIGW